MTEKKSNESVGMGEASRLAVPKPVTPSLQNRSISQPGGSSEPGQSSSAGRTTTSGRGFSSWEWTPVQESSLLTPDTALGSGGKSKNPLKVVETPCTNSYILAGQSPSHDQSPSVAGRTGRRGIADAASQLKLPPALGASTRQSKTARAASTTKGKGKGKDNGKRKASRSKPLAPAPVKGSASAKAAGADEEVDEFVVGPEEESEDDEYIGIDDDDAESSASEDEQGIDDNEDEEGEDEPVVKQTSKKRSRAGKKSKRERKKPRLPAFPSAEDWLAQYNKAHPVSDDDADLCRFQHNMETIIRRLCDWARGPGIREWVKLHRAEREMAQRFRSFLAKIKAEQLVGNFTSHMPRQSQKVLGKVDLRPIDLLDMPEVPTIFPHRGVYVNIPIRVPIEDVAQVVSHLADGRTVKGLRAGAQFPPSSDTRVYVGSTLAYRGLNERLRQHEAQINKAFNVSAEHYRFAAQRDVIPNFRMAGTWQNPHLVEGLELRDTERWVVVLFEGLLMTYLSLYDKVGGIADPSVLSGAMGIRTKSSFVLNEQLRAGIELPEFGSVSLNKAWPLVQGVMGGMALVTVCSNCQRTTQNGAPGDSPLLTKRLYHDPEDVLLGKRHCIYCYAYARQHAGVLPTREGVPCGRYKYQLHGGQINSAWFEAGNPRKCYNPACGVAIPSNATIYGIENGIRCRRCDAHKQRSNAEWERHEENEDLYDTEDQAKCSLCERAASGQGLHWWGAQALCDQCNTTRCVYNEDGTPGPKALLPHCCNAGCKLVVKDHGLAGLVEDILQHIWRCLACDWTFSVFGVEFPDASMKDLDKDALAPGPISHHRYNATKCIDCDRFATISSWHPVEGGGYKCDICNGSRTFPDILVPRDNIVECGNPSCGNTSANYLHGFFYQKGLPKEPSNLRCKTCSGHKKLKGVDRPCSGNLAQFAKRPEWYECGNPACDRTKDNWSQFGFLDGIRDEAHRRCSRCARVCKLHNREWEPKKCYGDGCDRDEFNYTGRFFGGDARNPTARRCLECFEKS